MALVRYNSYQREKNKVVCYVQSSIYEIIAYTQIMYKSCGYMEDMCIYGIYAYIEDVCIYRSCAYMRTCVSSLYAYLLYMCISSVYV